jgi:hypothetical protein
MKRLNCFRHRLRSGLLWWIIWIWLYLSLCVVFCLFYSSAVVYAAQLGKCRPWDALSPRSWGEWSKVHCARPCPPRQRAWSAPPPRRQWNPRSGLAVTHLAFTNLSCSCSALVLSMLTLLVLLRLCTRLESRCTVLELSYPPSSCA